VPVKGTVNETKNATIVETSIGTKKIMEDEEEEKVHHYVWHPASEEDYYHTRDGAKMANE